MKKKITLARLAELGIKGDTHHEEWDHPAVQWTESSRGLAVVIFEDEGRFWQLEIEYHPEDWSGTNDLWEMRGHPEWEVEVVEVVRETQVVWALKTDR